MAKKEDGLNWWVIVGVIALVVLIGKTRFAGTLLTSCENTEPTSLPEFQATIALLNGTMSTTTPIINIQQNGSNVPLQQYSVRASFGSYEVFPTDSITCNTVLAIADQQLENTTYAVIEEKQVLLTPFGLLFCNYANNIVVLAPSTSELSSYISQFTKCISREVANVTSPYVRVQSECERLNGNWINDTCLCDDGKQLELNKACLSVTSTNSGSGTTATNVTTTQQESPREEGMSLETIYIIGGILVVLFTLYWLFEKGPDKGLIRRRR